MNINPMALMKFKSVIEGFNARHPKFGMFLRDAGGRIDTGSVLEISVTGPNGDKIRTNFRVTEEDKELLSMLGSMSNMGGN